MIDSTGNAASQSEPELQKADDQGAADRNALGVAVLGCLEPDTCRTMAQGIADLLAAGNYQGIAADTAVERSGWAIATLLRVADLQEDAATAARLRARRQKLEAETWRKGVLQDYVAGKIPRDALAKLEESLTPDEIAGLRHQAEYEARCWRDMTEKGRALLERLDALEASRDVA